MVRISSPSAIGSPARRATPATQPSCAAATATPSPAPPAGAASAGRTCATTSPARTRSPVATFTSASTPFAGDDTVAVPSGRRTPGISTARAVQRHSTGASGASAGTMAASAARAGGDAPALATARTTTAVSTTRGRRSGCPVRATRSAPATAGLEADVARELPVDQRHALDLALRREALVEALRAELAHDPAPRREALLPPPHATVGRVGVGAGEVGRDADHRLQRDRARHHVAGVAPRVAPDALGRLEEVAHLAVEALGFACGGAGDAPALHVDLDPAMQLVEELRLEDPLLLLAAPAEPVDLVAERAVAARVEPLHDPGRQLPIRRRPRDALVEVDEVALVDARRGRVDDDEHLGREVFALAVEDDARDVDRTRLLGVGPAIEVQGGEAVLAVDDEVLAARVLQVAHVLEAAHRRERERLRGEQEDRAGNGRLARRRFVEISDRGDLRARKRSLERRVAALDARDELPDVVAFLDFLGRDLVALGVEAADEADALEEIVRRTRDEIEDAVLLPHLGREHGIRLRWSLIAPGARRPGRRRLSSAGAAPRRPP